jgi:hypothetical protein
MQQNARMAYVPLTCILFKIERNKKNDFLEVVFGWEGYDVTHHSHFLYLFEVDFRNYLLK